MPAFAQGSRGIFKHLNKHLNNLFPHFFRETLIIVIKRIVYNWKIILLLDSYIKYV